MHDGERYVTHHIPAGVFFGVKSIIGPGCVVNIKQFFKELEELEARLGRHIRSLVKIAQNAHIITDAHLTEDSEDDEIGTTKRGNGPAYRDKYGRQGVRAQQVEILEPFLVDMYEELHNYDKESNKEAVILCEGAQGFGLDVDWGDYPYVTSSHCTSAGALLNGIPPQAVRHVWGVAKIYETYVGNKKFQPDDAIFDALQSIGQEYGATTGRPRQCNWLNWNTLEKAIKINGVTDLVFNKTDILQQMRVWKIKEKDRIYDFDSEEHMKEWIVGKLTTLAPPLSTSVCFSGNPNGI
jgi:adenylosuccinate synthase